MNYFITVKDEALLCGLPNQYKNLIPNKTEIDEQTYKNIIVYQIGYVMFKDFSYATINSPNPSSIEESNENKYLALVSTAKSKDTLKIYE